MLAYMAINPVCFAGRTSKHLMEDGRDKFFSYNNGLLNSIQFHAGDVMLQLMAITFT